MPDPLIPDVDSFVHEKRNAFPFTVPAGENRQVLVDLFVPPGTAPGSYTGTVTVVFAGGSTTVLPFKLTVHTFILPSTSSMGSEYGITSRSLLAGHHMCHPGALCPANASNAAQRFDLYLRYLDMGLMHRISGASHLNDERWTIPAADGNGTWPVVNAWANSETFDRAYGSFMAGRDLPFGLKAARLTGVRLTCSSTPPPAGSALPRSCPSWRTCVDTNGNPTSKGCVDGGNHQVAGSWAQASDEWKGRVTAYWRELFRNFSTAGRSCCTIIIIIIMPLTNPRATTVRTTTWTIIATAPSTSKISGRGLPRCMQCLRLSAAQRRRNFVIPRTVAAPLPSGCRRRARTSICGFR